MKLYVRLFGSTDHPMPELYVLLRAIERMWGGADAKPLTVPPQLIYYRAVCAAYVHHVPEDVERWRAGAAHDVYCILQGFMESVALAIKDSSVAEHKDDGGIHRPFPHTAVVL
jgi:hypothetical protein